MNTWFRRLLQVSHLPDDALCRLINDEAGSFREGRARAHLAGCWQCRVRYEQLERAAHQVVEYRRQEGQPQLPLDPRRRDAFFAALDRLTAQEGSSGRSWAVFRREVMVRGCALGV